MAKSDITVDVHRGISRVWQITVSADPDEPSSVRDAMRAELESRGWDRALWHGFTARWRRGFGWSEVRAD